MFYVCDDLCFLMIIVVECQGTSKEKRPVFIYVLVSVI